MRSQTVSASSVELVTGPYRAGKSLGLLIDLVAYLSDNPLQSRPAILTVPSQRYKKLVEQRLAQIVKERGGSLGGLFGLKILPFYELCHFVLRQTGRSFRTLPDALRPAILEKAIAEVKAAGRLESLAEIAHFSGTHAGILELIDELERAGYAPSDVISTLSKSAASNSSYIELARIYEAYWRELERLNIYDERKLAYKTREVLNNLDRAVLPVGFLAVDGFDRFNRLQLQVLSALSEQADRSVICFDYLYPPDEQNGNGLAPDSSDSYRQTYEDYRWKEKSVREMVEAFGDRLKKIDYSKSRPSENHLPPTTSSWRSLDRMMEFDEVVRRLKVRLDQGLDPADAVVVVRSIAPYTTSIHAAFDKAQIKYFLDEAVELITVPLIKYLLRLLNLVDNDFVRQDVVRTLSSPFCNLQYLQLSSPDIESIDDQSLTRMVVCGREDWDWQDSPAVSAQLSRFFNRVTPPAGALSLTQFVTWIEDIIDDLVILPNDEEYADPLVIWEEHQALFEFRKVLSTLILEENLVGLNYAEKTSDYKGLLKRLDKALEKANFRRPNAGHGAVTVCGADLVPNRKFKAIFVAGLVEGEFPRRGDKAGFLSRDEVRKWMTYGVDIENPRNHESFEISLYKSLLERSTESLYMSCPLYEMDGEELIPSFFVSQGDDKVLAQIPFLAPNENAVLAPVSPLDMTNGILWYSGGDYDQQIDNQPETVKDLLERLSEPLAVVKARSIAAAGGAFKEWNGDISEQVRLGLAKITLPENWSVSRLNDFGKCPFRFWVSNILKIEKIKEPEVGLDVMLQGELFHKALELFYRRLKDEGLTIISPEEDRVKTIFEKSIADAIDWLEREKPFKRSEFWQYEQKEIFLRLRRFFIKEQDRAFALNGQYTPLLFEQAFGFDDKEADSAKALIVKSDGREIKIRGRIDRIDESTSGQYRVIDYKSGSTRINEVEALEGRNMQLPIYAMALSRAIRPQATVTGGSYLSISSGGQSGKVDFERAEQNIIDVVEQNIGRFVSAIASGNFNVKPSDPSVCNTCDHFQVCRITELKKTGGLEESFTWNGGDLD
jgi:ATP-dependent helicase/nuclease subunit B